MNFALDLPTHSKNHTNIVEIRSIPEDLLAKHIQIPTVTPSKYRGQGNPNFKATKRTTITSKMIPISPIKSMTLPPPGWWQYYPSIVGGADGYNYAFSPKGDKDTTISISYDGIRDTPYIAEILKKPPHHLSKGEINTIFDTACNMKIVNARTLNWNGKKALLFAGSKMEVIVSGEKKVRFYNLLYDGHIGFYSFIPVWLSFTAVPAKYNKYINVVKASFKTIAWEPEVEKPKEEIFYREGPNGELIPVKTESHNEPAKQAPSENKSDSPETN